MPFKDMIDFIKNMTLNDIFTIIGKLAVLIVFIEALCRVIPQLGKLRVKFWNFLARKLKHRKLEKKAIASDIENTVNEIVLELQSELPVGWVNRASIEWVDRDIKEDDLTDGEMIIRIRPLENQDINLINGIYFFFSKIIFPGAKEIIPVNVRKATALQISRRTIDYQKPFLSERFEKNILEPSIKEDSSVVEYIDKFDEIDKKGFFTGSFLREIHEIATRSKFKELRNRIEEEIKSVLFHIEEFTKNIPNRGNPEWRWSRKGPATSYAFLLVAQPFHGGVNSYVGRIKKYLEQGVERVYVMGANQERFFVKKVFSAVSKLPEAHLVELFTLNKDYRGDSKGIGALFVSGKYEKEAEGEIESFFEKKGGSDTANPQNN